MSVVQFAPELDLWPEEYTDCFRLSLSADLNLMMKAVNEAREAAGAPIYYWCQPLNSLFTDDQILTEKLQESLKHYDIPFAHTHIPQALNG